MKLARKVNKLNQIASSKSLVQIHVYSFDIHVKSLLGLQLSNKNIAYMFFMSCEKNIFSVRWKPVPVDPQLFLKLRKSKFWVKLYMYVQNI